MRDATLLTRSTLSLGPSGMFLQQTQTSDQSQTGHGGQEYVLLIITFRESRPDLNLLCRTQGMYRGDVIRYRFRLLWGNERRYSRAEVIV